jgi:hypothetical protein
MATNPHIEYSQDNVVVAAGRPTARLQIVTR